MPIGDPYSPNATRVYECVGCNERVTAERHPGDCEDCGEPMRDLSVPRE